MIKYVEFESERGYSKRDCLCELASFLEKLGDVDVVDIEKEWYEDRYLADYKPKIYLCAFIIYKEEKCFE